jgi:hypothetical protein
MLGFHSLSAQAISALKRRRAQAAQVAGAISGAVALWLLNKKRKWSVETPLGDKHFDTREDALAYYIELLEGPKPSRKAKKIRKLGKVEVRYLGKNIESVEVKGKRGIEVFREPILSLELQRLIEIEIALALQRIEDEELLLLAAALTA